MDTRGLWLLWWLHTNGCRLGAVKNGGWGDWTADETARDLFLSGLSEIAIDKPVCAEAATGRRRALAVSLWGQ